MWHHVKVEAAIRVNEVTMSGGVDKSAVTCDGPTLLHVMWSHRSVLVNIEVHPNPEVRRFDG